MTKEKLKKTSNDSLVRRQHKRQDQEEDSLKSLRFHHLIMRLHRLFKTFPDNRNRSNISKNFNDASMASFALFFTQSRSFLAYQGLMRESEGMDNAHSLFGIEELLSDNHIRNLMDQVPPYLVFGVFEEIFDVLMRDNHLSTFRSYNNNLLLSFDGAQYHSSKKICCESCNRKIHVSEKSRKVSYSYHHSVVMAVLVHPEESHVIPLPPEFITSQDGNDKQDCELNATRRWLEQEEIVTVEKRRWAGKRCLVDRYRYLNGVPLRDGKDAIEVNWFELTTVVEDSGDVVYHNSWVSNFTVNRENVSQLVTDGRARWKIENENNNVLKTKEYHLEHNFGHGKKYPPRYS